VEHLQPLSVKMEDKPVLEACSGGAFLCDRCLQHSSFLAIVIIWCKGKHCLDKDNFNV